jgi:replicative DNA helicase
MMMNDSVVAFETEQQFIGVLLVDGELIHDTSIRPTVFDTEVHRIIYETMLELKKRDENVDLTTIVQEMGNDTLERINALVPESPITYMTNLASSIPTTQNFKYLESKLVEHWKVRAAQRKALSYAENPNLETLTQLTKVLSEIEQAGDKKVVSNQERLQRIYQKQATPKVGEVTGYNIGFRALNQMTEGFHGGQFTIIGARPSVGKTALMLNVIMKGLKKDPNSHHTIFSIEMTAEQLLERLAAAIAKIPQSVMKMRAMNAEQWEKFSGALAYLDNANITIYDDDYYTTSQMRADFRTVMREYPERSHIMYIDYLTLIKPDDPRLPKTQQLGQIGVDLKNIARKLHVPVVCLAQLSRGVEGRQDKRPSMSDLRDSGELEQIADMIWLLYRDDYYDRDSEKKNIIEIIIDKQRDGATGTVELAFVKEYGLFHDLSYYAS